MRTANGPASPDVSIFTFTLSPTIWSHPGIFQLSLSTNHPQSDSTQPLVGQPSPETHRARPGRTPNAEFPCPLLMESGCSMLPKPIILMHSPTTNITEPVSRVLTAVLLNRFVVVFLWAVNNRKPTKRGLSYTGVVIALHDS